MKIKRNGANSLRTGVMCNAAAILQRDKADQLRPEAI